MSTVVVPPGLTWGDGEHVEIDEIDAQITPPAGCVTSLEHESRLTKLADMLEEKAMATVQDAELKATTMSRVLEVAIKARRAATELAIRREDAALVNAREKRIRDRGRRHRGAGQVAD